jgi:hypothetical protein
MTTCQKCGGDVQGWLCQGCGQSFREADGKLVFDHAARTTFDGWVLVPRAELESITQQDNSVETAIGIRGWAYSKLAAAPPVDGWQAIETAPRDGTPVLLLIDGVAIEGEWDKQTRADGYVYGDGQWEVVSLPSHGCSCCSQQNPAPTAWMPLRQPPNNERTPT